MRRTVVKNHEKFFSTKTAHIVARTHRKKQAPAGFLQNLIADEMAMTVVHAFKVIQIAQQNALGMLSRRDLETSRLIKSMITPRLKMEVNESWVALKRKSSRASTILLAIFPADRFAQAQEVVGHPDLKMKNSSTRSSRSSSTRVSSSSRFKIEEVARFTRLCLRANRLARNGFGDQTEYRGHSAS
jgi:hypothetical protein